MSKLFLITLLFLVSWQQIFAQNIFKEASNFQRLQSTYITQGPRAKGSDYHTIHFSVKANDNGFLENNIKVISDPSNPKYGAYLSRQEIADILDKSASAKAVLSYLEANGIYSGKISEYSDYVTASAKISQWESLLSAEFYEFAYQKGPYRGRKINRALGYSFPPELDTHALHALNTVQIPVLSNSPTTPLLLSSVTDTFSLTATTSVTPSLLNSYYSISNNIGSAMASQAVYEAINQSASPNDLASFQTNFKLTKQPISKVIGGHVTNSACFNTNNCGEANLDVQYLMAVAQAVPTTYYYDNSSDFLLTWALQVSKMAKPPQVFSISYGEPEDALPTSYLQTFSNEMVTLLNQGVTVLASSGDSGALDAGIQNTAQCAYTPQFPAAHPYITAVGGTQGPEAGTPEVVCQSNNNPSGVITSGGGFSNAFQTPSWQTAAVSTYLSTVTPKLTTGFTAQGRGYPDVSMLARNYQVVMNGQTYLLSGTSASAPVFAGLVTLVNSARIANGKPILGYINPTLYQYANSFVTDVTSGINNVGSINGGKPIVCPQGFPAFAGWDASSGLGSVNYQKFLTTYMAMVGVNSVPTPSPVLSPGGGGGGGGGSGGGGGGGSSSSSSSASTSLSTSAEAGIAIGVIGGVGIIAFAVYYFYRSSKFVAYQQSPTEIDMKQNPLKPANSVTISERFSVKMRNPTREVSI